MRKLLIAVTVAAALGLLLAWLGRSRAARQGDGSPGSPALARVTRRDVGPVVKATGIVRPVDGAEVRVGSRASGIVQRLHVRLGDSVVKGQLLAELETGELSARRARAAAMLAAARADRSYAQAVVARQGMLAASQAVASSELEVAERGVAVAEAAVAEAEANLALARIELGQARIFAPIGGVISSVSTQEGETVSASLEAPTFVTIVDLGRLEVWAYVDETDIGRIAPGQQARFSVDAYPGREFEGRVTAVYPKAEIRDNVVNYVAVVSFTLPRTETLRPEMTASVRIALAIHPNVLAVPRRALRREAGRELVIAAEGGTLVRREVTTGTRDDGYVEIVNGLREGEAVVAGDLPADTALGE